MIDVEREHFSQLLTATLEIYGASLTSNTLAIWWSLLEPFPLEELRRAFSTHLQDPARGRFAPKPADIIAALSDNDGRLAADEAWARCPLDERQSVAWNTEIAEAYFAAAHPLIEADPIAARMAFRSAYERVVSRARREGSAPKNWISLGHDAAQREVVTRSAVEAGWISVEYAKTLLPLVTDWPTPKQDPKRLPRS